MQPLSREELKGTWGTLLLPIAQDDRIDWGRLEAEIDALVEAGVDGIYSNGTAGEFYTQSEEEFDRVQRTLAERCERAGMPFQIGASHPCPQTALERARRAARLCPSAIQVILPDWYPVSTAEAVPFLERIARATDPIGLVLYNPPHAKRVLAPPEWLELARAVPRLIGVKVAGGDEEWYAGMRNTGLSLFVPGHLLASGFARGADGSYSNAACLSPRGAKRWNELMKRDLPAAIEIEGRLRAFMETRILPFRAQGGFSNTALDKLLAGIGGWAEVGLRLRWPYRSIEEREALRLRPIAREAVPELF